MAQVQGQRRYWAIAAGLCAAAIAIVVAVTFAAAPPGALVEDAAAEVVDEGASSSAPDAQTVANDGTDGAMADEKVGEFVPDEVLVILEDPAVLDALQPGSKIGEATVESVETVSEGDDGSAVVKIVTDGGAPTEEVVDALNGMEGVTAQKNFIYRLM